MDIIDESEVPKLLAKKIQPIIIQDTPKCHWFLQEFAPLAAEVEKRKKSDMEKDQDVS